MFKSQQSVTRVIVRKKECKNKEGNSDKVPENKKLKTCQDGNPGTSTEEIDDNPLGNYITKEYGLLREVLGHLSFRDLNNAALVCRTWASVSRTVERSRVRPLSFFWFRNGELPAMEYLPEEVFEESLPGRPRICVMFVSGSVAKPRVKCDGLNIECPNELLRPHCYNDHSVAEYVLAELPHKCPLLVVKGSGVVGTTHNHGQTLEIETKFGAYSAFCLPDIPGIKVKQFCIAWDSFYTSIQDTNVEMLQMLGLSENKEPIKCLLLFCMDSYRREAGKLIKLLQSRQEEQFVIGGGFFTNMDFWYSERAGHTSSSTSIIMGVVFFGESLVAASTILGSNVKTKHDVDKAMAELQSCNLPTKNSLAIMFACAGRGKHWFGKKNVESASFRRHFPNTPLLGAFGNGEIGYKHLPGKSTKSATSFKLKRFGAEEKVLHSYSTVVVYLGLGGT